MKNTSLENAIKNFLIYGLTLINFKLGKIEEKFLSFNLNFYFVFHIKVLEEYFQNVIFVLVNF